MQGDSLIFSVTSHFSNRQKLLYCMYNASLVLLRLGLSEVAQILHNG